MGGRVGWSFGWQVDGSVGGLSLTCPTSMSSSNKISSSDISVINNIIMIMHPFIHFYLTLFICNCNECGCHGNYITIIYIGCILVPFSGNLES